MLLQGILPGLLRLKYLARPVTKLASRVLRFAQDDKLALYNYAPTAAGTSNARSRYLSNSASLGAIGSSDPYSPVKTSVVLSPLPVMQSTVVSSGRMRSLLYNLRAQPRVTPPAVSVKMPSVSARS